MLLLLFLTPLVQPVAAQMHLQGKRQEGRTASLSAYATSGDILLPKGQVESESVAWDTRANICLKMITSNTVVS